MRYLFFISLFFILYISACQNQGNDSGQGSKEQDYWKIKTPVDKDWEAIKESGVLTAAIENSSTSYFLYKGKAMGYEYELLNRLAAHLGVRLKVVVESDIANAFEMLHNGEVDVVAFKLTITKDRKQWLKFTEPLYQVQQVLVQRKPDNWRSMKLHEIESELIRNPIDLVGKEVHVRKNSSYVDRLRNLSEEIGGDILIVEDFADLDTESIIKKVAEKEIDYTVSDDDIAQVNATYYQNLDVATALSFPQQIAWAMRTNADELEMKINEWLKEEMRGADYYVIYNRYFKSPKGSLARSTSDFSSMSGQRISTYDEQIKEAANRIAWDWRLLAALIYQESKFDPIASSWAGAVGFMQMMPATAQEFGANDPYDIKQNLQAGTNYLQWLEKQWAERIEDPNERIKFVLASYNVGLGHVEDARKLAEKYGADPHRWEGEVEIYLLKKAEPNYFNDEVVQFGYCRGEEPVQYVEKILYRYNQYQLFIKEEEIMD